jgi:hypothetical protein
MAQFRITSIWLNPLWLPQGLTNPDKLDFSLRDRPLGVIG